MTDIERRSGMERRRCLRRQTDVLIVAEAPGGWKINLSGGPWPVVWFCVGLASGLGVCLWRSIG